MSNLTYNQQLAVDSTGNVIVSAGAGSGKTRILTERVMKKINEGIKIDEFLILTFTKDAAQQMRDKIKEALRKANNITEMNKVDSAHIETFDAYALYIVKKYGYTIGLTSSINNVPEDVIAIKIKNEIKNILNDFYESDDSTLKDFVHTYCMNNDDYIVNFIYDFYLYANSQLNFDDFINNYKKNFLDYKKFKDDVDSLYKFYNDRVQRIKTLVNSLEDEQNIDKFNKYFNEIFLANNRKSLFDALNKKFSGRIPTLKKSKVSYNDFKSYNEIKDLRDEIKDFDFHEEEYFKFDVPNAQKFIPFVIDIEKKVKERVLNFEKVKGYFTFNDIARFAYNIVSNNEEIRNEIKKQIKLIFVDECQDNSDLQNDFLSLIQNDNLFCVGDIKQSIYLFRGANPSSFAKKYKDYKSNIGGQAIDLNDNFRSRKEIVCTINNIFKKLMTENFGGADYSRFHIINAGNKEYDTVGKIDGEHGIVTLTGNGDKDNKQSISELIIPDIKKRIANHQKIYDRETKTIREVTYKDFAILSPTGNNVCDKLEKELSAADIPCNAIYDEELTNDDSVMVILSIMKAIKILNSKINNENIIDLKHYYVSIVRSFLYRYDDDKIYHLIKDDSYKNDDVYLKLREFANKNRNLSIKDLFENIINEFNILENLKYFSNPLIYIYKINTFFEKIAVMDSLDYEVDDFIEYLDNLRENKISMDVKHSSFSDNAVTLTTIHKSKGLEYKIVYLVNLKDQRKNNDQYKVNNLYGASLKSFAGKQAIQFILSKNEYERKFYEEKLRLLYVALTRAEDTCIIVDNEDILSDEKKKVSKEKINGVGKFLMNKICDINFKETMYASMPLDLPTLDKNKVMQNLQKDWVSDFTFKELSGISFEKTKVKHTASKDLKPGTNLDYLEKGTHMHLLMQIVDFTKKDTSFINNEGERKLINKVLNNDLFKNVDKAKIYKEYQFIDLENNKNGVIDLLLVFQNFAYVIDYKLKNIDDDAYKKQLKVYYDFVKTYIKKDTKCFLLSLIDGDVKEVIIDE